MYLPVAVTSVQLLNLPVSQVDIEDWDSSSFAPFVQKEPLGWMLAAFSSAWGAIAGTGSLELIILPSTDTYYGF